MLYIQWVFKTSRSIPVIYSPNSRYSSNKPCSDRGGNSWSFSQRVKTSSSVCSLRFHHAIPRFESLQYKRSNQKSIKYNWLNLRNSQFHTIVEDLFAQHYNCQLNSQFKQTPICTTLCGEKEAHMVRCFTQLVHRTESGYY